MTQAILMLLFSSGGFVFLSSSCGIFFARLIPSSSSFFGYFLLSRMAFKSSNFCFERSSSLTIVLIRLSMLNGMLTFVCLGCPESKVMWLNE